MNVSIVDFDAGYAESFKNLNYEWISKYFEIEDSDRKMLEDPQGYIIDRGGSIFIALMDSVPVGTCALLKASEESYELAKMAVAPQAQGHQIGYRLGQVAIERARSNKAKLIFLETNSTLKPALRLYEKLGFKERQEHASPYTRCNVQLELTL